MLKLKWMADLKAEQDFRAMGIEFVVKQIRFSQIDLYESSQNGARTGDQIVRDLVADYMQGLRNGDAFPRPVVYLGKKGYILTSGNQRSNAIKELIATGEIAGDPLIEVYELQTGDKMLIEAVTRAANVAHGGRSSLEDRVAHAVYMARHLGMAVSDAAKLFMVAINTINNHLRIDTVRRELGERGIDTSSVAGSTLEPLAKIDHDARAFSQLGALVSQHKPTAERVKQIVSRVAKAKSDNDRAKLVKSFESELTEEVKSIRNAKALKAIAPKAPVRPRRDKLLAGVLRLADFLDFGNDGTGFTKLSELQIASAADEKSVRDGWARLEMRMALILKKR